MHHSRREFLKSCVGMTGLTLPMFFKLQAEASGIATRAKSCIVIYTWGGMSHLESFDPKPEGPSGTRGEFGAIRTATPGMQFCEHLPHLAKHSEKLAVVRSVHHDQGGHQGGMYVTLTGHKPERGIKAKSSKSWPSLPAMISRFQDQQAGIPGAVRLPYSMYDNGTPMAGEHGGWLGSDYHPLLMRTPAGEAYAGVTRYTDRELSLKLNLEESRLHDRRALLKKLDQRLGKDQTYDQLDHFRQMAADMLLGSPVRDAYDLEKEDPRVRAMYGDHICGQSLLLSRRQCLLAR